MGGFAVAFHGHPRFTEDLDLFVQATRENAARIMTAIRQFGFGSLDLSEDDFVRTDHIVQLGLAPNRIDLLTTIAGVSFEEAWDLREAGELGGVPVSFIGFQHLIANKLATGRQQDAADASTLIRRNAPRRPAEGGY